MMYREQLHFNSLPFQEKIDSTFFYPGGGRRNVLEGIKDALVGGVHLIALMGEAGSGKTIICRMVEAELPNGFVAVFIPHTVESYDDVVRVMADSFALISTEEDEIPGSEALIAAIVDSLQEQQKRLLIIFDDAEKIYLATLERMRVLLDQLNDPHLRLQFILSGNSFLDDNLRQL